MNDAVTSVKNDLQHSLLTVHFLTPHGAFLAPLVAYFFMKPFPISILVTPLRILHVKDAKEIKQDLCGSAFVLVCRFHVI